MADTVLADSGTGNREAIRSKATYAQVHVPASVLGKLMASRFESLGRRHELCGWGRAGDIPRAPSAPASDLGASPPATPEERDVGTAKK